MKQITTVLTIILVFSFTLTVKNTKAMEKKKVEKTTVLMYTMKSTLATISTDAGEIPNELMTKAAELGLEITGPQIWQYRGVDGNPNATFDLDICVPVANAKGDAGKFKFVDLPEINCISHIHNGPYSQLSDAYNRIFGEMGRKGLIPTGASREVYHVCDFENQENCKTEIQVVVQ